MNRSAMLGVVVLLVGSAAALGFIAGKASVPSPMPETPLATSTPRIENSSIPFATAHKPPPRDAAARRQTPSSPLSQDPNGAPPSEGADDEADSTSGESHPSTKTPPRVADPVVVERILGQAFAADPALAGEQFHELSEYLRTYRPDAAIYAQIRARVQVDDPSVRLFHLLQELGNDPAGTHKALFKRVAVESSVLGSRSVAAHQFAKQATAADADFIRRYALERGPRAARGGMLRGLDWQTPANREMVRELAARTDDVPGAELALQFLRFNDPADRRLMLELVGHPDDSIRTYALATLGRHARPYDAAVLALLLGRLRDDPIAKVRRAALEALLRGSGKKPPTDSTVEAAIRAAAADPDTAIQGRVTRQLKIWDRGW